MAEPPSDPSARILPFPSTPPRRAGNAPAGSPPLVDEAAPIGSRELADVVGNVLSLLDAFALYIQQVHSLAQTMRTGGACEPAHLDQILENSRQDRTRLETIREAYARLHELLSQAPEEPPDR